MVGGKYEKQKHNLLQMDVEPKIGVKPPKMDGL